MNQNKKRGLIAINIILIIIIIPISFAQTYSVSDFNDYSSLTLSSNLDTGFRAIKTSNSGRIDELNAFLSFFPENTNLQTVNSIEFYSSPEAEITKETEEITFKWQNPTQEDFNLVVNSTITTNNALIIIDKKSPFPTENNGVYDSYVSPTEFIDITPEIRAQAEELVEGEDDLYVVAFKVGNWVNQNVNYNLTTLTAEVVQKSSWVLERKEGVCDEITNLFISMMRSLGIPARFVSGMVYTNLDNKWQPHGWAEVYFPDKGWVPFDVTYGQLGWIDPTHVKLKVSADSGEAAIKYMWRGEGTTLEGKEIELNTDIISKGEKISSPLEFEIRPLTNNVGPGSFVPLEISITNRNSYYLPDIFIITKATELTEKNYKITLLKPGQTKKLFWITKTPEDLNEGYIYTSTVEVEDQFHSKESTVVNYASDLETVTLREAKELIEENSEEIEQRIISKKLDLICTAPRTIYKYEQLNIDCKLKNRGNTRLEDVNVCYLEECEAFDLSIAEERDISYTESLEVGEHRLIIEAENGHTKTTEVLDAEVLESPQLEIQSLEYPNTTNYKGDFDIKFTLITKAPVKLVEIKINDQVVLDIQELREPRQVIINTNGRDIYNEEKEIKIDIFYKDINGREYSITEHYPIEIQNIPWYIKFLARIGLL